MNVSNRIYSQTATCASATFFWTKCCLTRQVSNWNLWVLWLICLIELGHGQRRVWPYSGGEQAISFRPIYFVEPHHMSPVIIDEVSLRSVPNDFRPSGFNLRASSGTTSESLPELGTSWMAQHAPVARGQYRSINARNSNPAKAPLSPQAFFPSSVQRQLPLLSVAKPSLSSRDAMTASVVPQAKQTVDHPNTNHHATAAVAVDNRQIDRLSQQPQQTFQSVTSENIDKVETIGDVNHRMVHKQGDSANQARRISKRKLEQYDHSLESPVESHQDNTTTDSMATISTRPNKQTNDSIAWNGQRNDSLNILSTGALKGTNESNYANENTKQTENAHKDNKPDSIDDAKDNQNKGEDYKDNQTGTSIAVAADQKQPHYFAYQKGIDSNDTLKAQLETMSTKDTATVFGDQREDEHDNNNEHEDSEQSDTDSNDSTDEDQPEEDSKINHYSSSIPETVKTKEKKQSLRSLVSKGYSNRDRGFGFIKAWAWDRAENYRVKEDRHRDRDRKSQQLGQSNWKKI